MTITISYYVTPCAHEVSDSYFNCSQIMQFIVTCATW
jgi:hypothetical protein